MVKRALARRTAVDPIKIGGFTLNEKGMDVSGRPTFGQYAGVGEFIMFAVNASPWWRGDWLRYGESRDDWKDRLSQLHDATGLSEKTLKNERAVAAIPASRRRDGLDFGMHAEVAGLEPDAQVRMLDKAERGGWDRRDLRHAVRKARRTTVLEGRADTMHTVEVVVQVEQEGETPYAAEELARTKVKTAVQSVQGAKVISAHARPQ